VLALLRAVGHALKNEDAARSIYLRDAVEVAWKRWKTDLYSSQIFYGFIEAERNTLLKQYRFTNERKVYVEDETGARKDLVIIGGRALAPATALRVALEWFEAEVGRIQRNAANFRQESQPRDH
jgi:hypothetical protein